MTDSQKLQTERNKLFSDYYNNVIPERMPVQLSLGYLIVAEIAGLDTVDIQFEYSRVSDAARMIPELVYSDTCPVGIASLASRIAGGYQMIDSQSFRMGANGQMQHPEVIGMLEDEYGELIDDPYACILEKILPRQHSAFSLDDPVKRSNRIMMLQAENNRQISATSMIVGELTEKYGYYKGAPAGSGGFTAAPYDYLGDQLRSFSGISTDIRRRRNEIIAACESLLPLMFNLGLPKNPAPEGIVGMPLHMPTYMREKDFTEVWLPTYLRLVQQYAARGIRTRPFHEHDWMRYLDIIQDFPAGTLMAFEYGDPKTIKDKLGKKFLITGLYPINLIKTGTKDQVIDKAKEMLDIMLPGCGYVFGFDKGALMLSDLNLDNFKVLSEFLRDHAKFDNAGQSFGMKVNSEIYAIDPDIGYFESKYLTDWDEYKEKYPFTPEYMKDILHGYDIDVLRFYLNLLC